MTRNEAHELVLKLQHELDEILLLREDLAAKTTLRKQRDDLLLRFPGIAVELNARDKLR